MKFVSRKALAYIRDECDKLHNLSGRISPDMKAIATDSSKEDSAKVRYDPSGSGYLVPLLTSGSFYKSFS